MRASSRRTFITSRARNLIPYVATSRAAARGSLLKYVVLQIGGTTSHFPALLQVLGSAPAPGGTASSHTAPSCLPTCRVLAATAAAAKTVAAANRAAAAAARATRAAPSAIAAPTATRGAAGAVTAVRIVTAAGRTAVAGECLRESVEQRGAVVRSGRTSPHAARDAADTFHFAKRRVQNLTGVGWLTPSFTKNFAVAACYAAALQHVRSTSTSSTPGASSGAPRRVFLFTNASKVKGVKVENVDVLAKRSTQLPFLLFGLGVTSRRSSSDSSRASSLSAAGTSVSRGNVGLAFLQYILHKKTASFMEESCMRANTNRRTLQHQELFTPLDNRSHLSTCNSQYQNLLHPQSQIANLFSADASSSCMFAWTSETADCAAAAHVQHSSSTASYISSLLLPHLLLARSRLAAADCGLSAARLLRLYRLTRKALIVCYATPKLPLGFFSLEEGSEVTDTVSVCATEANERAARIGVNLYREQADECCVALNSVERALGASDFLRLQFGVRGEKGIVDISTSLSLQKVLRGQPSEKEMILLRRSVFPHALELLEKLLLGDAVVSTDVLRLRPQYPLQEGSRKKPVDRKKSERNYLNKIYRRMDRK